MKKIIISLLLVAMISMMIIPAYAAGTSITVAEQTVFAGETVAVDVAIAGNTGFANGKFTLDYNKEVLTLTAIDVEGKLLENGSSAINLENATISFASAEEIAEDGVLFTATFTVKADAALGEYDVKVTAQDMVTTDGTPVTVEVVNGTVTVECDHDWQWVIDKEPQGSEAGEKHEECTKCGAKRNEGTKIEGENPPAPTGDSVVSTVLMMVSVVTMIAVAGTVSYRRRLSK
jgi:hypothetical protein